MACNKREQKKTATYHKAYFMNVTPHMHFKHWQSVREKDAISVIPSECMCPTQLLVIERIKE